MLVLEQVALQFQTPSAVAAWRTDIFNCRLHSWQRAMARATWMLLSSPTSDDEWIFKWTDDHMVVRYDCSQTVISNLICQHGETPLPLPNLICEGKFIPKHSVWDADSGELCFDFSQLAWISWHRDTISMLLLASPCLLVRQDVSLVGLKFDWLSIGTPRACWCGMVGSWKWHSRECTCQDKSCYIFVDKCGLKRSRHFWWLFLDLTSKAQCSEWLVSPCCTTRDPILCRQCGLITFLFYFHPTNLVELTEHECD